MGFSPVNSRLGIIATGARPERLDVPGEREFIMRGVAYSSGWYAPLFSERTVAVVGPGLRAIQGTRHLARFARQVFVITPSASRPIWERESILQATNVSLMSGWRVVSILGTNYVKQVKLERQGAEKTLDVDGVFVCAGISPNSSCVAPLVELTPSGAIKVDRAQRTSQPGLLAAGDVTDPLGEQILVALGAGARAGMSAWETRMREGGRVTQRGRPRFQRSLDGLRGHMHNGH
jgi:thioredoxin reductase